MSSVGRYNCLFRWKSLCSKCLPVSQPALAFCRCLLSVPMSILCAECVCSDSEVSVTSQRNFFRTRRRRLDEFDDVIGFWWARRDVTGQVGICGSPVRHMFPAVACVVIRKMVGRFLLLWLSWLLQIKFALIFYCDCYFHLIDHSGHFVVWWSSSFCQLLCDNFVTFCARKMFIN